MRGRVVRSIVAASILMATNISPIFAQDFPTKPIRLVVPYAAGGSTDIHARLIARKIDEKLKNPVIVENRPGANSAIGANYVATQPADGYTLIYFVPSLVSSVFVKNPQYDVLKAFSPVAGVYTGPLVLAIHAELPGKTLAEFVAYAKANRGKLNYGTNASSATLAMEMFKSLASIDLEKIEYKLAITPLMANEVQAVFGGASTFLPAVRGGGKVRILAVASDKRLAVIPDVPTMAEAGYPRLKSSLVSAVMAPAGIPKAIVDKIQPLVREALGMPEMQKALFDIGTSLFIDNDELMKLVREEIDFWAEAARVAKFQPL